MEEDAEQAGLNHDEALQYLTFQLAGKIYGINISSIREIIEYGSMTTVPMMPDFIEGVINLRGRVVPVVNLAKRFGAEEQVISKKTSVIILEISDESQKLDVGVVVDIVNEVLDILPKNIEPAPAFGANIRTDFISGMGKVGEKILVLLNIKNVLSVDELSSINQAVVST
jgi:purine-binding chemotaxis protein CheW